MLQENITHSMLLEDFIVYVDEETGERTDIVHYLCNIHKNKMMTFAIDILNEKLYLDNIDGCSEMIQEFKAQCESRAKEYGIHVI